MLKGIDVSSWQGNIQVQNMPVDFVIAKATGIEFGALTPYMKSGNTLIVSANISIPVSYFVMGS